MAKTIGNYLLNFRGVNNVIRFAGTRVSHPQSVSEHSFGVGVLATIMHRNILGNFKDGGDFNVELGDLLLMCQFHDMGESFTGDMNYFFKRAHPDVDKFSDEFIASNVTGTYLEGYVDYLLENRVGQSYVLLKFCDMLELAIYSYEEVKSGNQHMMGSLRNGIAYTREFIQKYPWLDCDFAMNMIRECSTMLN